MKEIDERLNSDEYAKNARALEALEKESVRKTDRLAGLLRGYKVQQSAESDDLREESVTLLDACPRQLKNQGPREVKIHCLSDEDVIIPCPDFTHV